jgi:CBS domain containing-hemolysin-like protein
VNIVIVVLASVLLMAFAGLMAAAESALGVMSVDDLRSASTRHRSRRSLEAMANQPRAHRNVATFARIVSETIVAVLVTATFLTSSLPLWAGLLISIAIMTTASFVLAGSSPQSVGRARPEAIVAFAAPLVHLLRIVLGPVADLLVSLGDRVTPGRSGTSAFASEEQLLSMVDEATRHDVLEKDERELIHSIFEWGDTHVREVMVPRIDMVTVDADTSLAEAGALFLSSGLSRIPVIGDDTDDIVGVLYLRDVARISLDKKSAPRGASVRSLAHEPVFLPELKKADDALRDMQASSTHLAFVVDEHGGIAGLVTLEDLLEELVGEIRDEFDRGAPEALALPNGRYRVSARMHIEDLGELFGIDLTDDEVDSVGGLLAKELERVPEVGDRVVVSGLHLEADRVEARRGRVTNILVWPDQELLDAQAAFGADQ